jgi:UDP-N-acetylmuramate dehydrogenase
VKTSAAWLIEAEGFTRGDARGPVALSSKHALALTNRGGATTEQLVAFAHEIAVTVEDRLGVALVPEPVLVGVPWC